MPFAREFNYFFLYLSSHLEREHGVHCRRADQRFSTQPVLDKVNDYIRGADLIIADCTGNNPNVLYELGIAHALAKDVVLITQDAIREVPSDIRMFEFVKYDLGEHGKFLRTLDEAVADLLIRRYDRLYERARELCNRYMRETNMLVQQVGRDDFIGVVKSAEIGREIPSDDETLAFAQFVLPIIIQDSESTAVMTSITGWLLRLDQSDA